MESGNVELGENVRLVLAQFRCKQAYVDPNLFRRIKRGENHSKSGNLVIEPTKNVSLEGFSEIAEEAGYSLVDATLEISDRYIYSFTFIQDDTVTNSEELEQKQPNLRAALSGLCNGVLWRTRIFEKNPFYEGGELVDGVSMVSINCDVHTSLFDSDGQPQMRWQTDEDDKRVGKKPLEASHRLVIFGDNLFLL